MLIKSAFTYVVSAIFFVSFSAANEPPVARQQVYPVVVQGDSVFAYLALKIDDFRSAPIDLLNKNAANSASNVNAISFITTYYEYAKQGNRSKVLESFSEELRPGVARRYSSSKDIRREFDSLKSAKLLSILDLRAHKLMLVEHLGIEKDGQQRPYSWVHVLQCSVGKCLIVEDQSRMQFASNIFALLDGKTALTQPLRKLDSFESVQITEQVSSSTVAIGDAPKFSFLIKRSSEKLFALGKAFGLRAAKLLDEQSLGNGEATSIAEIVDGTNWIPIPVLQPKGGVADYSMTAFQQLRKKGEEFDARYLFELGNNAFIGVYLSPKSGRVFVFPLLMSESSLKISAKTASHPLYEVVSSEFGQKSLLTLLSDPVKK